MENREEKKSWTALFRVAALYPGQSLPRVFVSADRSLCRISLLLRASGYEIISTNRGYICTGSRPAAVRVLKMCHSDEDIRKELNMIVDMGGTVEDVFIRHRVYGELRAPMHITSRLKVERFIDDIKSGKSSPLKNVTSDYHYHTITAESEEVLDYIENTLKKEGICIEMAPYEK